MTALPGRQNNDAPPRRPRRRRLHGVFLIPTVSMYLILFVPIIVALIIAFILWLL